MRTVKIILAVGITAMVVVVALVLFVFGFMPKHSAKHLARVDWLPSEASDVTYVKRDGLGWFTCYECDLPRTAFDRLARTNGWKPEPKSEVFNTLRRTLGLPALKNTELGEMDIIAKALFYESRHPNGGGITVIYDLDTSRLFVHKSHR